MTEGTGPGPATGHDFIHRYMPGSARCTLLLLHGTGGSEDDLLELGATMAPGASLLSPRGKVLERGMPRFFRRLAEGVFDLDDLEARTHELADFVSAAAARHAFDPTRVIAAGFSNGANIAASLLLLRPAALAGAVLFRAMVPLVPDPLPDLSGKPILLASGKADTLIPQRETERLAGLLEQAGAKPTVIWQPGGHNLTSADVEAARTWLGKSGLLDV